MRSRPQRRYRRTLDSPSLTVGTLAGLVRTQAAAEPDAHHFLWPPEHRGARACPGTVTRWLTRLAHPHGHEASRRPPRSSPAGRLRGGATCAPTPDDPGAPPQTPALPRRVETAPGPLPARSPAGYQTSSRPSTGNPPLTDSLRPGRSDDARSTRDPADRHDARRRRRLHADQPTARRRRRRVRPGRRRRRGGCCTPEAQGHRRGRPAASELGPCMAGSMSGRSSLEELSQ